MGVHFEDYDVAMSYLAGIHSVSILQIEQIRKIYYNYFKGAIMKTYIKRILDSIAFLLILIVIGTVLLFLNLFSFNNAVLELSRKIYHSLAESLDKK